MAGITGFKVALCIAYLRIVPPKDRRVFNPLIWVVMVTCILGHLGGSLVLFFMCTPVSLLFPGGRHTLPEHAADGFLCHRFKGPGGP